jgi:hypothetical protein
VTNRESACRNAIEAGPGNDEREAISLTVAVLYERQSAHRTATVREQACMARRRRLEQAVELAIFHRQTGMLPNLRHARAVAQPAILGGRVRCGGLHQLHAFHGDGVPGVVTAQQQAAFL